MAEGFRILSPDLARNAEVSAFNRLQAKAMNGGGGSLFRLDAEALSHTVQRGIFSTRLDNKVARFGRGSPDGTIRLGVSQCLFWDMIEGGTINQQRWTPLNQTIGNPSQAVGSGTVFGQTTTIGVNTGNGYVSTRFFPFTGRASLIFRSRVRLTVAVSSGTTFECGFGSPVTANPSTGNAVNGAHWRRDGDGNFIPVLVMRYPSAGSFPEFYGTPVPPATVRQYIGATDWFTMEVELQENRAIFRISAQDGTLVNEQVLGWPSVFPLNVGNINGAAGGTFTQTHLQVFYRLVQNSLQHAISVGEAFVAQTSVWQLDRWTNTDYGVQQASMADMGSLCSPSGTGSFAFNAQLTNYSNSVAPTGQGQSNTTCANATMGGTFAQSGSFGTLEADSLWFGAQMPTPYGFVITRINIAPWVGTAVVVATGDMHSWAATFNASALSLATGGTYPPRVKTLGITSWLQNGITASQNGDVTWEGKEYVAPNRFLTISSKPFHSNSNTPTTFRGTVCIDGYFE